jgi:choline dehydrogenase
MRNHLGRRSFLMILSAAAAASCARDLTKLTGASAGLNDDGSTDFEYVVIGSGAGGGPLAVNLARNGHKVLLLEAGDDRGNNLDYQVPAFHTQSSEDPAMSWAFFVHHYADASREAQDSKATSNGVFYPRAGTLGGCTAHNAMITVYPHAQDFDGIAQVTGDSSWSSDNMRQYFQILERCSYLDPGSDKANGHGFSGWLPTSMVDPTIALGDGKLPAVVGGVAAAFAGATSSNIFGQAFTDLGQLKDLLTRDLNAWSSSRDTTEGLYSIPLATNGGHRSGTREYILQAIAQGLPLTVRTNCLATRLLFADQPASDGTQVVTGVEYLEGAHLYRADPNPSGDSGTKRTVTASREVIVSAGAFNTPQLLKLSGIGPSDELGSLGIATRVALPGVGSNLQDRYEVGIISQADSDFALLGKCTFALDGSPDPCRDQWQNGGGGPYQSNGGVAAVVKRSSSGQPVPDLFIFGLPGLFKGYYPGYSQAVEADKSHFTWAVLKAHTQNTAGTVKLLSADPRDVPDIQFHYFDEGSTDQGQDQADLSAVVSGVKFVRSIISATDDLMPFGSFNEVWPGPNVQTDDDVATFVRNEAWGHHASCTCKIGADSDPMAVLDSKFRVRGTTGLRVVDASVFPKIPGFFIVTSVYMISEKATDDILAAIGETRS